MLAHNDVLQSRYRIIRQLGQGGMGTVYEAIDERFESQVALKQTHFTEEVLRRQFEREARLLNKLRHPAMTRVIDYFSEADNQFLVMDYVQGEDLGAMLERNTTRPFPMDEVLAWGDQLLDALDYIHSQTPPIIHRDIKPQNLKLTERNKIILLDFGLAKGSVGGMTTVATTKSVLGYSLSYAPLEQILKVEGHWIELLSVTNAEEVEKILTRGTDPRSDLYSLAATLLHLMTGKVPPNAPTRALSVWTGRTDSLYAAFGHGITREVGEVLERAMKLSLDERFADAVEMRLALRKASRPHEQIHGRAQTHILPPTIVDLPPTQRAPQRAAVPPSTVTKQSPVEKPHKPTSTVALPITPPSFSRQRLESSTANQEPLSHMSKATHLVATPVLWAASIMLFLLWIISLLGFLALGFMGHLLLVAALAVFAVNLFVVHQHNKQASPAAVPRTSRHDAEPAPREVPAYAYVLVAVAGFVLFACAGIPRTMIWAGSVALETNHFDVVAFNVITYLLAYGIIGLLIGTKFPKGDWTWGLALAILPILYLIYIYISPHYSDYSYATSIPRYLSTIFESMAIMSAACIGAKSGMRYSSRRKNIKQ